MQISPLAEVISPPPRRGHKVPYPGSKQANLGGVTALFQRQKALTPVARVPNRGPDPSVALPRARRCRSELNCADTKWTVVEGSGAASASLSLKPRPLAHPQEVDPLYLFACHMDWENNEDPGAAWELIAAAQSADVETRAHARALLASSRHLGGIGSESPSPRKRQPQVEEDMKAPYGLNIIEDCCDCPELKNGHFCDFSLPVLNALTQVGQKSILPSGAILFVEGQSPRGVFIVCSGKVNLSTTSRGGKILILKTAGPGEALGLSATVSDLNYETTAETATPCHVNFVERKHFLEILQEHPEIGLRTAQCLSRDYQSAHRDIHDLVLTRSSTGKLARLLLSQAMREGVDAEASCRPTPMTHEEMAMRIGASRETVTRLISSLRRKRLIRLDGPMLVIKDRTALEALAV